MSVFYTILHNQYRDSVTLMQVSKRLLEDPAVKEASVVMATPSNLEQLQRAGLPIDATPKPTDLLIVIDGDPQDESRLFELAQHALTPQTVEATQEDMTLTSLAQAYQRHPDLNFALISVPGTYAAAEALKALARGMNVMLFSDNVSIKEERFLKDYAHAHGLLVMGPDCGTAIIQGAPLGFANRVAAGHIGIVAASGTGLQEVSCRITQLGGGISHALGTGGRDVKDTIGGITMIDALIKLQNDPSTHTIVIVSKPPAPAVLERVMEQVKASAKPTIVHFLGAEESLLAPYASDTIHIARHLAEAAHWAVTGEPLPAESNNLLVSQRRQLDSLRPGQRFIRGLFAGGTFNYETQLTLLSAGLAVSSNAPVHGASLIPEGASRDVAGHAVWDMGDDTFTQGRPHPMIDPSLRNQFILEQAQRDDTALILFDVVLGFGAHDNPLEGLLPVLEQIHQCQHPPILVAHVCGTALDPQNREAVIAQLQAHQVIVAPSNWHAAKLATDFVRQINHS